MREDAAAESIRRLHHVHAQAEAAQLRCGDQAGNAAADDHHRLFRRCITRIRLIDGSSPHGAKIHIAPPVEEGERACGQSVRIDSELRRQMLLDVGERQLVHHVHLPHVQLGTNQ